MARDMQGQLIFHRMIDTLFATIQAGDSKSLLVIIYVMLILKVKYITLSITKNYKTKNYSYIIAFPKSAFPSCATAEFSTAPIWTNIALSIGQYGVSTLSVLSFWGSQYYSCYILDIYIVSITTGVGPYGEIKSEPSGTPLSSG